MKKVLTLIVSFLLIGTNLYAAGDLIVNGKVGVGQSVPKASMDVRYDRDGLGAISGSIDNPNTHALTSGVIAKSSFVRGGFFWAERRNSGDSATSIEGLNSTAAYTGSGSLTSSEALVAGKYTILFKSTGGGSATVQGTKGLRVNHLINDQHTQTTTLNNAANFVSDGIETYGPWTMTVENFKHFEINEGNKTVNNQYGIFINKLTKGTNNYGIVLNGDGSGADIVFGPTQSVSIYSNAGELYAEDQAGNITQISPHDPKTGEWIFYSKNVKTGKVVRVNMEELIRDMEKLTGKKYMIETFVNER